jgi:plastocyanin
MRHLSTFFTASALLICGWCQAGNLEVSVTTASGKPAANVVVQATLLEAKPKAPSPKTLIIEQRELQFSPYVNVVQIGSTVRFTNVDPYDHHVRSTPTGPLGGVPAVKDFEMRLGAATAGGQPKSAEVAMDKPGVIGLGCHLHGSMRGHLLVTDTPYFAKTNAQGVALIEGLPQGKAQVKLWHPDQLTEQTLQNVQIPEQAMSLSAPLNFNPKARVHKEISSY